MQKHIFLFILLATLIAGCSENIPQESEIILPTAAPTLSLLLEENEEKEPPAYLPQPGDSKGTKAKVQIDTARIIFIGEEPVEVELIISGYLPTPCHELRININPPDGEGIVIVDAYSITEPDIQCEQVLRAFNEKIILGTYPPGSYWVWINDIKVGNFDF